MKYDNYIFDLYGTLADIHTNENKAYLWKKCAEILSSMGFPYDAKKLKKDYVSFVKEKKAAISDYHTVPEIELRHVFRKLMSPWCKDEEIDQFAITFRVLSREFIKLYTDIVPIFDLIHENGGRVFLLSNAQACFTVPELKLLGIYDLFDDVFISSDMECAKPDPDFMNMLVKKNGLDISRSIMIGNDYTSDIKIANLVGMDSMYVETATSPKRIPEEKIGATYVYYNIDGPTLSMFEKLVNG